ncbi:uracil-DNA glycosylase family protein [Taklimakanibacter deserti]|uniref:uracil-DNA glycosylase family protein n=1 Tax=Taklimakanibacter deserti TaxID=2267839 RepID=UPI0034D5F680
MSSTAKLLIVGQAPGTRVHASGRPFTDPSGVRLRQWLGIDETLFYDERHVAIVPMGFCFPGQNAKGADLPPRPECAPAWRAKLLSHLNAVRFVICLGRPAQHWHLGELAGADLTETVRNWRKSLALHPKVLALPHPSWRNNAWLKKNPWFADELLPVLRKEMRDLFPAHRTGRLSI